MSQEPLSEIREQVLHLHEAIVADERIAFERIHGRQSAGAFLDVLVKDPSFAWLSGLTTLIVRLDEVLDAGHDEGLDDERAVLANLRALLVPDEQGGEFQRRYAQVLQRSPDVLLRHGAIARLLKK
jgi:hypothetical protein